MKEYSDQGPIYHEQWLGLADGAARNRCTNGLPI
jgi:hypothetical protein